MPERYQYVYGGIRGTLVVVVELITKMGLHITHHRGDYRHATLCIVVQFEYTTSDGPDGLLTKFYPIVWCYNKSW